MSEPRQIQRLPEAPGWWALLDRASDLIGIDIAQPGHSHMVMARREDGRIKFSESVSEEHAPVCPDLWAELDAIKDESELTCEICGAPGDERPGHYYHVYCSVHRPESGEVDR